MKKKEKTTSNVTDTLGKPVLHKKSGRTSNRGGEQKGGRGASGETARTKALYTKGKKGEL